MTIPATEAEVRAIAAGLSKDARRGLLQMTRQHYRLWPLKWMSGGHEVHQCGLIEFSPLPYSNTVCLTPLGLQDRATLTGDPS